MAHGSDNGSGGDAWTHRRHVVGLPRALGRHHRRELDLLLLRLQQGIVSVVVPIDKLSMLVSMRFAAVVLRERYTKRSLVGLALVTIATFAMAVWT